MVCFSRERAQVCGESRCIDVRWNVHGVFVPKDKDSFGFEITKLNDAIGKGVHSLLARILKLIGTI
jgi:hypothetical protein